MSTQAPITVHPTTEANWGNENVRSEGLHLRDYFAAKALQGLLANEQAKPFGMNAHPEEYAVNAYRLADAMMRARGNQP